MPKEPNRLPAPLSTNVVTLTAVMIGAMMTATSTVMIKTAMTTMIIAKMIASPSMTTAQIAREADKAAVTGLITPSTPSTPVPSAPTTLTLISC